MTDFFVIVIAGPTGVGKTTLSKMLSRHCNCAYISEDEIAKDLFPNTFINIEDFPDEIKLIDKQLLK